MLKPHTAVVYTQLNEGEAVLLHMGSKLYYSLNPTGSFLWKLLEANEAADETALTSRVKDHYQISTEMAQADVREFIRDLKTEGLLEEVP